jgi:hypothetical protein
MPKSRDNPPSPDEITNALIEVGWNKTEAAKLLGMPRSTLNDMMSRHGIRLGAADSAEIDTKDNIKVVTVHSKTLRTIEDVLKEAEVDLDVWEVERSIVNKWDVTAKVTVKGGADSLAVNENWQIKIWLRRKTPEKRSIEHLLEKLRNHSLVVPKKKWPAGKGKRRRALEVCIMDPHLGLECFRPGSDEAWDLDACEKFFLWALDGLLKKAEQFTPFLEIVWVFGNDFLHADTVFHTTTQGTQQPEAVAWHTVYERGKKLAIAAAERLCEVAPLRIVQVSGNHDRLSSYTLAHVLDAYFHGNENVTVEVSSSPYKFWQFGVNLVGFDHGHSPKMAHLAALMANETRLNGWQSARYCEWHLGDQHRRGGGRPTVMTEQGVGVEFLTGLTPANEWHKLKTFNWQPRGATAYVWDADSGPEARLLVNIDSYTGRPMGEKS